MNSTVRYQAAASFTQALGIQTPLICGAMYPCSNPELVGAVSHAGGIGIVQPISLTYVHGYDFRAGLQMIKRLSEKPIGMNVLIETASSRYRRRMEQWIDIALEEGVRFFVTSLGKPDWVVQRAHAHGALVYHDATEYKWAAKGVAAGIDGLIGVNNRAGGHAGTKSAQTLYDELSGFKLPLILAGGVSTAEEFVHALDLGYAGVQMGTRFIATNECNASAAYKQAIVEATEHDIVLSERITGVPVSVIHSAYIAQSGLKPGAFARRLLRGTKTKHLMRMLYTLKSLWQLKRAALSGKNKQEYWQAGKSVAGIQGIEPAKAIVQAFHSAYQQGRNKK